MCRKFSLVASYVFVTLLLCLTGCSGGPKGSAVPSAAPSSQSPGSPVQPAPTPTRAPAAPSVLYVVDSPSDSILTFPLETGGNISPLTAISGAQTQLDAPAWIAVDTQGNVYVTNHYQPVFTISGPTFPNGCCNIEVFSAGANGNVAPARLIGGSNTGFAQANVSDIEGVAVDAAGNIYVGECINGQTYSCEVSIAVFNPGADGNAAPARTIQTGCYSLSGLAVSSAGVVSLVCQSNPYNSGASTEIVTFAAGAQGAPPPLYTIVGSSTGLIGAGGLALSPTGALFVANVGPAPGEVGNIPSFPSTASGNVSPSMDIVGSATDLDFPTCVAITSSGNIYVLNNNSDSIVEYHSGANGNTSPINIISGANTQFATTGASRIATGPN